MLRLSELSHMRQRFPGAMFHGYYHEWLSPMPTCTIASIEPRPSVPRDIYARSLTTSLQRTNLKTPSLVVLRSRKPLSPTNLVLATPHRVDASRAISCIGKRDRSSFARGVQQLQLQEPKETSRPREASSLHSVPISLHVAFSLPLDISSKIESRSRFSLPRVRVYSGTDRHTGSSGHHTTIQHSRWTRSSRVCRERRHSKSWRP